MDHGTDWRAWHAPYADEASPLSRRLRIVQAHISAWLDSTTDEAPTVVSACAGDGRDILQLLDGRPDADRFRVTLIETDPHNADAAAEKARAARLPHVEIRRRDAGITDAFAGAVPAGLVLMCGVFGNISDSDVRRTISSLPELCSADATVIWTRSRRDPDLTPTIRQGYTAAGFREQAFEAPVDALFCVGVHQMVTAPQPLRLARRIFSFE